MKSYKDFPVSLQMLDHLFIPPPPVGLSGVRVVSGPMENVAPSFNTALKITRWKVVENPLTRTEGFVHAPIDRMLNMAYKFNKREENAKN